MNTVVEVSGLRKTYGCLEAVGGIDLKIGRGEIFGILGHNGAGKTTTVECVLGTRKADSGSIHVLGLDPIRDRKRLYARVGVQFQESRYQDKLRVSEACRVAASLYPRVGDWKSLLARFGLAAKEKTCVNELSGGERQKLSVVLALMNEPELIFLDELTTGLDPAARRGIWKYLKELKAAGTTIVLTSHYMDEVEFLCDRIALLKEGKIAAQGTPAELIGLHGVKNLEEVFLRYMEKDPEEIQEAV